MQFLGFQLNFSPIKVDSDQTSEKAGDGLISYLILPLDFSCETLSEAYRILTDYRRLPNIERWCFLETKIMNKSPTCHVASSE
jgi:hypothetical protein